jgi:hypothetical protein
MVWRLLTLKVIYWSGWFASWQLDPWERCYLQPYLDGEWIHEAEEPGGFPTGDLEEDGDAQVHERLHGQEPPFCL